MPSHTQTEAQDQQSRRKRFCDRAQSLVDSTLAKLGRLEHDNKDLNRHLIDAQLELAKLKGDLEALNMRFKFHVATHPDLRRVMRVKRQVLEVQRLVPTPPLLGVIMAHAL